MATPRALSQTHIQPFDNNETKKVYLRPVRMHRKINSNLNQSELPDTTDNNNYQKTNKIILPKLNNLHHHNKSHDILLPLLKLPKPPQMPDQKSQMPEQTQELFPSKSQCILIVPPPRSQLKLLQLKKCISGFQGDQILQNKSIFESSRRSLHITPDCRFVVLMKSLTIVSVIPINSIKECLLDKEINDKIDFDERRLWLLTSEQDLQIQLEKEKDAQDMVLSINYLKK